MPNSYSMIYLHFVFSTKDRAPSITQQMQPKLHGYIASMINDDFGIAKKVGGTQDHIHVIMDMKRIVSPDQIMCDTKSHSSKWFKETTGRRHFGWQDGYGVFSVSASAVDRVVDYIEQQAEHHRKMSFAEEYEALMKKHGIKYDPKYLL